MSGATSTALNCSIRRTVSLPRLVSVPKLEPRLYAITFCVIFCRRKQRDEIFQSCRLWLCETLDYISTHLGTRLRFEPRNPN